MRAHVCISLPVGENCYALQNIWHFDGIKENEMTAVSGLRCDRMTLLKFYRRDLCCNGTTNGDERIKE